MQLRTFSGLDVGERLLGVNGESSPQFAGLQAPHGDLSARLTKHRRRFGLQSDEVRAVRESVASVAAALRGTQGKQGVVPAWR